MTTVVYIAALGRSGSTLLELLLATHPGIQTVGELQILPHELRGDGRIPCGCGRAVADCAFWAEVVGRVDPATQPAPQLDFFREHHDWGPTLRPGHLAELRRGALSPPLARMITQYGRNTAEIVEAVAETHQATGGERPAVVVDNSKDPYRLLWLARSGAVDLRVVHLVRDPRGSVHSLMGDYPDAAVAELVAARRAAAWVVENALVARVCADHVPPHRWTRITYEDLARDPVATLAPVLGLVGQSVDPDAVERYRHLGVHTIAGNPMRSARRPVALDERWRREMAPRTRRVVEAVTGRGRARVGH